MVCKNMASYLNRKKTIFTLAEQLSTLCHIDILLILYGPDMPNIPKTWCSQPDPATVLDKYYAKKKLNKPPRKNDDQFESSLKELGKLSFNELNNLNQVLEAKIEFVNQRINGFKEGDKGFSNSYQTRDLIDCGKTGYIDYNDELLNVEDLGSCQGNNSRFVDDVTEFEFSNGFEEGTKGFNNSYQTWDFGFGFDFGYIDYNDGMNVEDLGVCQGINQDDIAEFDFRNPMWTTSTDDYCEDTDELMIDISDLNDIKFVGEDLQLINQLATVQDAASATEFLCY